MNDSSFSTCGFTCGSLLVASIALCSVGWAQGEGAAISLPTTQSTSTTAPSTTLTTRPLDLSSPRTAATEMRTAVREGNEMALREILAPYPIGDDANATKDPRVHLSDAQASVIFAGKHLAEVMRARFGDSGDRLAGGAGALSSDTLDSALANLTDQQFTLIDPNQATLKIAGDPQGRILFRRVGHDATGRDVWHVDLSGHAAATQPASPGVARSDVSSTQPVNPLATTTSTSTTTSSLESDESARALMERATFMRRLAIGLNEAADDIEQGRRRTLDDARAAIVEKFHSTIARSIQTAATRPTTASTPPK